MDDNDGKLYEKVIQAVFQTLVEQVQVENISVQHDLTLQGKAVEHQIDVYWQFSLSDINYRTVVECRDWNTKVKQKDILAFKAILEDLNNPIGIMVTRTGYQEGALQYAQTHGILLYELFEEPMPAVVVKEGSFGKMKINPSDMTMEWVYYETDYNRLFFEVDATWVSQEQKRLGVQICEQTKRITLPPQAPSQCKIYDEQFTECGDFLKVLRPLAAKMFENKENEKRCKHSLQESTFVKVNLPHLPFIKILSVSSNIVIKKHPPVYWPINLAGFVPFILNNLQSGSKQRISIKKSLVTE